MPNEELMPRFIRLRVFPLFSIVPLLLMIPLTSLAG